MDDKRSDFREVLADPDPPDDDKVSGGLVLRSSKASCEKREVCV
jgi:hypothetical protein